ncbi:Fibroin heavy chain-like [Balamuthia mandrillaris]
MPREKKGGSKKEKKSTSSSSKDKKSGKKSGKKESTVTPPPQPAPPSQPPTLRTVPKEFQMANNDDLSLDGILDSMIAALDDQHISPSSNSTSRNPASSTARAQPAPPSGAPSATASGLHTPASRESVPGSQIMAEIEKMYDDMSVDDLMKELLKESGGGETTIPTPSTPEYTSAPSASTSQSIPSYPASSPSSGYSSQPQQAFTSSGPMQAQIGVSGYNSPGGSGVYGSTGSSSSGGSGGPSPYNSGGAPYNGGGSPYNSGTYNIGGGVHQVLPHGVQHPQQQPQSHYPPPYVQPQRAVLYADNPTPAGLQPRMLGSPDTYTNTGFSPEERGGGSVGRGGLSAEEAMARNVNVNNLVFESSTQRYELARSDFELALMHEIRNVRKNPRYYAQILINNYRPYYRGNVLRIPGQPGMMTHEGVFACDDAIRFLQTSEPLFGEIEVDFGMSLAAKEAISEHAPRGSTDDPNSVYKLEQYGEVPDEAMEMIGYGGKDAQEMVLFSFIICDGDQARHTRAILFDPRWRVMGIGAGEHNSPYKVMGVVNLTTEYYPNVERMTRSPLFKWAVKVGMKKETREIVEAFRQLQDTELGLQEQDDRAAKLRAAAKKVSEATKTMVDSTTSQ